MPIRIQHEIIFMNSKVRPNDRTRPLFCYRMLSLHRLHLYHKMNECLTEPLLKNIVYKLFFYIYFSSNGSVRHIFYCKNGDFGHNRYINPISSMILPHAISRPTKDLMICFINNLLNLENMERTTRHWL